MSKKDTPNFIENIHELLETTNSQLKNLKKLTKEKKPASACKKCNDPLKLIYMKGMCKECYNIETNRLAEAKAGKRWISTNGYEYVYDDKGKQRLYHRYRMEQLVGRPLTKDEEVRHIDGNKANNEDDNLLLTLKAGVDLRKFVCKHCSEPYLTLESNAQGLS